MIKPFTRARLYDYADGKQHQGREAREVFESIAQNSTWISEESLSGIGSTMEQTRGIIQQLPAFLAKWNITSLLDAPCGDFNWMQHVNLRGISYTGGDIVPTIAERNQARFGSDMRTFQVLDLMSSPLGSHDLLFCRDCLVHLSCDHIRLVIQNLRSSGIRYLLTTHFPEEPANEDIVTGGWRPLNLTLEPFFFPEPLDLLVESCTEMNGAFADKSLALWEVGSLTR